MKRAAHNREILAYGFLWNSPQNVQTEFQTEGMDKIGERLKAGTLRSRRKSVHRGGVAAKAVQIEFRILRVDARRVIRHVPAGIDDHVLPAKFLEVFRHPLGVRANVGFADGFGIGIPTVPTHGRSCGKFRRFLGRSRSSYEGHRSNEQECDECGSRHCSLPTQ